MKIVKQLSNASHGGLVFFDEYSAKQRNLSNVVGRYDKDTDELLLLIHGDAITTKIRALIDCGVHTKMIAVGSNYYCSFDGRDNEPVTEAVVSTDLPTTIDSPAPKVRRVIYKDQCVGVMENDEFYLDPDFELALDHEFEFYDEGDDSDVYIDPDFQTSGLDILSTIIDKRLADKIKEQKAVIESVFSNVLDEETRIQQNQQRQRDKLIADTLKEFQQ
ncbi:hypothetical protein ACGMNB_18405 [Shewanella oncorhynchi]|uniref:hypothetical protein n=1 Tax=Shewanella oncorhynchi TaxID=2726434 RepID=UPI003745F386